MADASQCGFGPSPAGQFWALRTREELFLAGLYLSAKEAVLRAGYEAEIEWQRGASALDFSEQEFLREMVWVILSCGMSVAAVSAVFPRVVRAFHGLASVDAVLSDRSGCRRRGLRAFGHPGKINAILYIVKWCKTLGFETVRSRVRADGTDAFLGLPFLGPASARHLAKNLGVGIAKPDRHLERIAGVLPVDGVDHLCATIGALVGERVEVVDLVLWRACVIGALRPH